MKCIKELWQRFVSWWRNLTSGAAKKEVQCLSNLHGMSSAKPCVPKSEPKSVPKNEPKSVPMNEAQHLVFWLTGQYSPFRLVQR